MLQGIYLGRVAQVFFLISDARALHADVFWILNNFDDFFEMSG
ncbi:MAG: hypothetical protein PHU41_09275 [Sulfuricurvum sp.]|nr:hypothetical protein [Sulfuricurvum sp.]